MGAAASVDWNAVAVGILQVVLTALEAVAVETHALGDPAALRAQIENDSLEHSRNTFAEAFKYTYNGENTIPPYVEPHSRVMYANTVYPTKDIGADAMLNYINNALTESQLMDPQGVNTLANLILSWFQSSVKTLENTWASTTFNHAVDATSPDYQYQFDIQVLATHINDDEKDFYLMTYTFVVYRTTPFLKKNLLTFKKPAKNLVKLPYHMSVIGRTITYQKTPTFSVQGQYSGSQTWGLGVQFRNLDATTLDPKPNGFSQYSWLNIYNYYSNQPALNYLGNFADCANFTSSCSGNLIGGHVLAGGSGSSTLPTGGGPYYIIPICNYCNNQGAGYSMVIRNKKNTYVAVKMSNFMQVVHGTNLVGADLVVRTAPVDDVQPYICNK